MITWGNIFPRLDDAIADRATVSVIVMVQGAFFGANVSNAPAGLKDLLDDDNIRAPLAEYIIATEDTLNTFPKNISWDDAVIFDHVSVCPQKSSHRSVFFL